MNELSNNITEYLKQILDPDKMQNLYSLAKGTVKIYLSHEWQKFYGHGCQMMRFINEHLNNSMPDYWNETTGQALQEFLKGLGG